MKIIITAIIVMILTFVLSRYLDREFKVLLEYAAIIVSLVGLASVFGSNKISRYGDFYNMWDGPQRTRENILKSYHFLIFMVLVAGVLFIVTTFIW